MSSRLRRRILLTTLAAPLLLWGLYVGLANGALWVAPRCLGKREPVSLQMKAHTWVPGIVHVREFRLRAEDRWVQWGLTVDRATVRYELLPLFERTFHANKVDASGVAFRLRVKRTEADAAKVTADAIPPIPGFAPLPVRDDARFPSGLPLKAPWTLSMKNVTAEVKELWVEGVRYEGAATATGEWAMSFDRSVSVGPARLALEGGDLHFRGERFASNLSGPLDVRLDAFNPREVKDGAVLNQLSVNGNIGADGQRDSELAADIRIDHGIVAEGASFEAKTKKTQLNLGAVSARGDLAASVRVGADQRVDWRANSRRVQLNVRSIDVTANALAVSATSRGTKLCEFGLPTNAALSLGSAKLADLRALNAFIPDPLGLNIEGGSATASASFRVNLQKKTARGSLRVRTAALAMKREGRALRGELSGDFQLTNIGARRMSVKSTDVALTNMTVNGAAPFSAKVAIRDATIDLSRKEIARGHVSARFDDARPLFRAVVDELPVPKWAKGLIAPNDVRAEADVAFGRRLVRVDDLTAQVGRFGVKSGMRLTAKDQRAVTEISAGPLRVGVERVGRRTLVEKLAERDWYHRKRSAASL